MNQYNIKYNKTSYVVLGLILPGSLVPICIFLMAKYIPDLPDWALITSIIALIICSLILTFKIIRSVDHSGILTLNDDGFIVAFIEQGPRVPPSFEVKIADIINYRPNLKRFNFYMSFTTTSPQSPFNICCTNKNEEDVVSFIKLMEEITKIMEEKTNTKIKFR